MKKSWLLVVPAIALLASCGKTDASVPATSSGAGGVSSAADSIKNPWWKSTGEIKKDSDGKVVYDEVAVNLVSVVSGDDLEPFKSIVNDFNTAYRGKININVESVGESSFEKTISDRVSQNSNPPDLIMSHQKGHKSFADNQIVQPFDEAISASGIAYSPNDIVSNLADDSDLGYSGHVFNIPVDGQSVVLLYNKTLMNKYATGGKLPENASEFQAVCQAAKTGEGSSFIPFSIPVSGNTFFQRYFVMTSLMQNNFAPYGDDYKVTWGTGNNKDAFVKGIDAVRNLFYGSSPVSSYGNGTAAAYTSFYNDRSLFLATYPWEVDAILSAYGEAHNNMSIEAVKSQKVGGFSTAGIFQADPTDANAYKIFGDSHAFILSKTVTDVTTKAACLEFVHWFINDVQAGIDWANAGHISASHYINNADAYKNDEYVKNYIQAYYTDINEFVTAGNTPYYTITFDELNSLIASCMDKAITDSDISSKATTSANKVNAAIEFINE